MSLQIFNDSSAAKSFRIPPRTGTSATRANTLPVASGASRCSTSHSTEGQNYTEPSRHSHTGSKQRNTGKAQEDVWTQTCRSSQQPEGTQIWRVWTEREHFDSNQPSQCLNMEEHNNSHQLRLKHRYVPLVTNLQICPGRAQVSSQDSGTAEIVESTGMRMVMVMRMSIPLTSRSSFLWSDTIDNVLD